MTSSRQSFTSRRDVKPQNFCEKLTSILPEGYKFGIYHISTPPTRTSALYSAPPDERPDKTYAENHFLAITIDAHDGSALAGSKRASPGADEAKGTTNHLVLVLGLEVFLFTTAYATTLFISKADSTGYLHLLNLPRSASSPIRDICTTFIAYLLEHRRRRNIQTVVSLFARAQSQYLFPLSVENSWKHVLSDWGLVRWWCRVLNQLLEEDWEEKWGGIRGYLTVPGLEERETRALLPQTPASSTNWVLGHPLEKISHYTREYDWVPLRCLIPKFPDDPKSRYRDELDEEAARWKQNLGPWKSVKSLSQFWEMMAHRQECSSGRLTGFIWMVFDPKETGDSFQAALASSPSANPLTQNQTLLVRPPTPMITPATPPRRRVTISVATSVIGPPKADIEPQLSDGRRSQPEPLARKKKRLTGLVVPRLPHIKTEQRNYLLDRPTSTAYYYWPREGQGEKIVDESDYKRIVELLLHLDFSSLDKALRSTRRWLNEVGMGAKWGQEVTGRRLTAEASTRTSKQATEISSLIRKRSKVNIEENGTAAAGDIQKPVNVLGAGILHKKKKEEGDPVMLTVEADHGHGGISVIEEGPKINVIRPELIMKSRAK